MTKRKLKELIECVDASMSGAVFEKEWQTLKAHCTQPTVCPKRAVQQPQAVIADVIDREYCGFGIEKNYKLAGRVLRAIRQRTAMR